MLIINFSAGVGQNNDSIIYDEDFSLDDETFIPYEISITDAPVILNVEMVSNDSINFFIMKELEYNKWLNYEEAYSFHTENEIRNTNVSYSIDQNGKLYIILQKTSSILSTKIGHIRITTGKAPDNAQGDLITQISNGISENTELVFFSVLLFLSPALIVKIIGFPKCKTCGESHFDGFYGGWLFFTIGIIAFIASSDLMVLLMSILGLIVVVITAVGVMFLRVQFVNTYF